jgi:surface polysaccharide O-acyltransferase-like enzyme
MANGAVHTADSATQLVSPSTEVAVISKTRVDGIDTLKFAAIVGVVYIHTGPFRSEAWRGSVPALLDGILNQSLRFGVPLFFLASGYFFMKAIGRGESSMTLLRRYNCRLLRLFALWSFLFLLAGVCLKGLARGNLAAAADYIQHHAATLGDAPLRLVLQGTMEPLWFLPALVLGLAAVTGFLKLRIPLFWGSALLAVVFVVGLLGASYQATPLGWSSGINTRNGPFVGAFFVSVGAWLALRPPPGLRAALALTMAGWSLTFAEAFLLRYLYGAPVASHDNLLGTTLYAVGVFGIALARPGLGSGTRWPLLGRLALGVYLLHMIVALPVLHARHRGHSVALDLATPVLVTAGAICVAWVMSKSRIGKRLLK